jgi:hypothetical protein
MPAVTSDRAKTQPAGAVADERVAAQQLAEGLLQVVQGWLVGLIERGRGAGGVESGPSPGLLVGLDQERAAVRGVGVGVGDEGAVAGGDRREDGAVQREVGAAPQIQARAAVDADAETAGIGGTGAAADPVRR